MNSTDVRDILELGQPAAATASVSQPVFAKVTSGKKKKMKRLIEPIKRPQGVHREVWGLMCKYDADQPPLIPSHEPKVYKHPKANLRNGVRRWHFVEFKNPARTDSATFSHWRCVNDDPNKEYPFAKFNKQVNVLKYTEAEYSQYLSHDDNWSRAETDHLFDLCKRFDLRFYIISDRWDPSMFPSNRKRTIDELKDRYYKVVGILQRLRGVDESQIYVFDYEHEHKRREQLEKLFNRSKEQVDEELYLMEELKKIEIRKKERERKQQDINKLLTAAVDIDKNMPPGKAAMLAGQKNRGGQDARGALTGGAAGSANKRLKQRKLSGQGGLNKSGVAGESGNNSLNNSSDNMALSPSQAASAAPSSAESKNKKALLFKSVVESAGIKFPDNKTTGVALRSFKMKLPQSVGLKKLKVIEQLLDELQIEQKPIATENICEQFNELRSDIVLLYELQQALTNYEFELQTLRHRYESIAPGKPLEPTPFESSLASSTSSLFSSLASANTPQKRITEIIDSSITPTGPLERRRRAALNQTNILKKLRGRNP